MGRKMSSPAILSAANQTKPVPGTPLVLYPFQPSGDTSISSSSSPYSQGNSPWSTPSPGQHMSARQQLSWSPRTQSPNPQTSSIDSSASSQHQNAQGQSSDSSGSIGKNVKGELSPEKADKKQNSKDQKVTFLISGSESSANSAESGFSEQNQGQSQGHSSSYADVCSKCLGEMEHDNQNKGNKRDQHHHGDKNPHDTQGNTDSKNDRQRQGSDQHYRHNRGRQHYHDNQYNDKGYRGRGQGRGGFHRPDRDRGQNNQNSRFRHHSGDNYQRSDSDPKPRTRRLMSDGEQNQSASYSDSSTQQHGTKGRYLQVHPNQGHRNESDTSPSSLSPGSSGDQRLSWKGERHTNKTSRDSPTQRPDERDGGTDDWTTVEHRHRERYGGDQSFRDRGHSYSHGERRWTRPDRDRSWSDNRGRGYHQGRGYQNYRGNYHHDSDSHGYRGDRYNRRNDNNQDWEKNSKLSSLQIDTDKGSPQSAKLPLSPDVGISLPKQSHNAA